MLKSSGFYGNWDKGISIGLFVRCRVPVAVSVAVLTWADADTEVLDKLGARSFYVEQREKMIPKLSFI